MYRFKKSHGKLPRVRRVLGFLRSVPFESLLDVGSGRGAFLIPFLEHFPHVSVTAVDLLPERVEFLETLRRGGIRNLTVRKADICMRPLPEKSVDIVTLLEVLEHIPRVEEAVKAAVETARKHVVVTVPSKEDSNPEHIHLLTKERLTALFEAAGCSRLRLTACRGIYLWWQRFRRKEGEMKEYNAILKYPRTPHLEGSRLQPGDEDLSQIRFDEIRGKHLVVEEKCDGANTGISFGDGGELLLQSRGHYLTGGYRERHYNLLKQWANVHREAFYRVLGERYIMYGEWMYAKHTVYYDALPHYFLEFDIYDREREIFLDTPSRKKMTEEMPVVSVPVLAEGEFMEKESLLRLLGPSAYIREGHLERLRKKAEELGLDGERQCRRTDPSVMMEGLYMKEEKEGQVAARMKYVRASFLQCVDFSEKHWLDQPIVENGLAVPLEELYQIQSL